jgi:hypothetical protein
LIPILPVDFVRIEKSLSIKDKQEGSSPDQDEVLRISLEIDVQNREFEHEIKKKIPIEDLEDEFWKENLKMNFPEIYTDGRQTSKQP